MEMSQALQRYRDWLAFLDQTEADLETKLEQQRGAEKSQPLMTAAPLPPTQPPAVPLTAPEETMPAVAAVPATLAAPPTTAPEEITPAALPRSEADPTLDLAEDEEKPAPPVDEDGDWVSELLPEMDAFL